MIKHWITELHNKYKGKDIWIAGSDPTLDNYPDNFFNDKIGITLHLAYFKFPNATYRHFSELDRFTYCLKEDQNILDKTNIFGFPFYHRKGSATMAVAGKNVYFFKLNPTASVRGGDKDGIFTPSGVNAMIGQVFKAKEATTVEFGGYWTCLHVSMYTAIMMGGNPINLIGCNHKTIEGKNHFLRVDEAGKKMRPRGNYHSDGTEHMIAGTNAVIKGCHKYGIKVNRFKDYKEFCG